MTRKAKPPEPEYSCANCKHQFPFDRGVAECREAPMVYIPEHDRWMSPPAPDDFLCGRHVMKCNS